jgi:hypothetical protein
MCSSDGERDTADGVLLAIGCGFMAFVKGMDISMSMSSEQDCNFSAAAALISWTALTGA